MSEDLQHLVDKITEEVMRKFNQQEETISEKPPVDINNITTSINNHFITGKEIARMIDHTLLKPESTKEEIINLCEEAIEHQFFSVCINPYWVTTAAKVLEQSNVGIATVIGFPLGTTSTFTKVSEARDAIASGATEIDMVINIVAMKYGDY